MIQIDRYPKGFDKCTACGQCCKRMDEAIKELKQLFKENDVSTRLVKFPYKWDETGKCEKLGEDGRCTIYNERPNVCNISWIQSKLKIGKNKFYDSVVRGCNQLMDEKNVPLEYRIKKDK